MTNLLFFEFAAASCTRLLWTRNPQAVCADDLWRIVRARISSEAHTSPPHGHTWRRSRYKGE